MTIGESIPIFGSWFYLHFIENKGMAFGMSYGGDIGKLMLSLLRIALVIFLFIYIHRLIKTRAPIGVLLGLSLITVGALGNIFDCAFYGLIFNDSTHTQIATLFPDGGGYASFLHGKVVDMLYFPLIEATLPDSFPIWGGREFIFFRFIFNIADSCVTIGIFYLFIFQRSFFKKK